MSPSAETSHHVSPRSPLCTAGVIAVMSPGAQRTVSRTLPTTGFSEKWRVTALLMSVGSQVVAVICTE